MVVQIHVCISVTERERGGGGGREGGREGGRTTSGLHGKPMHHTGGSQ